MFQLHAVRDRVKITPCGARFEQGAPANVSVQDEEGLAPIHSSASTHPVCIYNILLCDSTLRVVIDMPLARRLDTLLRQSR